MLRVIKERRRGMIDRERLARAQWRKSTRSGGGGTGGGDCVQAVALDGIGFVGDSKNPDGPVIALAAPAWTAFIAGIKNGEHEHL
jgi:hypothetical protein